MFVPCLFLISISSYVVQGTKETGNINAGCPKRFVIDEELPDVVILTRFDIQLIQHKLFYGGGTKRLLSEG